MVKRNKLVNTGELSSDAEIDPADAVDASFTPGETNPESNTEGRWTGHGR